ncbi:helix-turn-helix domain-containing protein [Clostridium butyricum]|uniref:response regulator transcription factor n=1 Tax=Clostridium butyricum TaxID=1492 RepID=UPI00051ACC3D|nr:response regulator transcription factor [Clostridium butyricum]QUF81991.1 response regulator transcription factor [Clostridium butyricum]
MFPNLRAEMTRNKIRTKDIAEVLHVSEKTVRNYLSGRTKISWFDVLTVQAKLFPKLEVDYLFEIKREQKVS